jgi:hypothetical protein
MTGWHMSLFSHWSFTLLGLVAYSLNLDGLVYPAFFSFAAVTGCGLLFVFGQYAIWLRTDPVELESQLMAPGFPASYPIGALPVLHALVTTVWPPLQTTGFGRRELLFCLIVFMPAFYNACRAYVPAVTSKNYALFDAAIVIDVAVIYVNVALVCSGVEVGSVLVAFVFASLASKAILAGRALV